MKAPKAPAPPNPTTVAAGQTATNIGTSIANTIGGQVEQITPEGSLEYQQRGTYEYTDPLSGDVHEIPLWRAITELSPEQQAILDESQRAELGLAGTAADQSEFLRDYLGKPADFDTRAIEDRLYELGSARLDPRFDMQEEQLRSRLANQGIEPGSRAFAEEMRMLNESRNDAYNQLMLQGRGQAFGEIAGARNQPINEITALLSGSQVSMPNVSVAQPSQIPTTDYAGIMQQDYANRMGAWQQNQARKNSLLGGLFGLGGTLGGAAIGAF